MSGHGEQQVLAVDQLRPGDLIGCHDGGVRIQVLTTPHGAAEPIWLRLVNDPRVTTHAPGWGGWGPVPPGNVALDLADYGWVQGVFPAVLSKPLLRSA